MITSFWKTTKKINHMNTLFKDLELKHKNSKYYKGKIAPNLISRQNWSELCIWNNERSLVQVLTRPHCWVNSRNQYKIDFFFKKIPIFYLFVFHYYFILWHFILINLLFICCILEEAPGNHFLVNWSIQINQCDIIIII